MVWTRYICHIYVMSVAHLRPGVGVFRMEEEWDIETLSGEAGGIWPVLSEYEHVKMIVRMMPSLHSLTATRLPWGPSLNIDMGNT